MDPFWYNSSNAWDQMHIAYQSPVISKPEEATYLFVGETHNRSRTDAACLIHQQVQDDSVLILEGFKSLIEITHTDKQRNLDNYEISYYTRSKLKYVVGWDDFNHLKTPREPVYMCQMTDQASIMHVDPESVSPLIT